jgi:hypothetical protein
MSVHVLITLLLIGTSSCNTNTITPPSPQFSIRGVVRLPQGVTFPHGAKLRIVVKWYDTPLANQLIDAPKIWPAAFSIPIAWPQGKGEFTQSVEIFARAELAGRDVMISQLRAYTSAYETDSTPFALLLHPAVE